MSIRSLFNTLFIVAAASLAVACGKCRDADCHNDGFCSEGECICQKWYSGESCDLEYNRNYVGTYYGTYEYSNGIEYRSIDSIVVREGEGPNMLILESGLNLEFVTDSTLLVPEQILNTTNATYSIEGEGVYSINFLSFEYIRVDEATQELSKVRFEGQKGVL